MKLLPKLVLGCVALAGPAFALQNDDDKGATAIASAAQTAASRRGWHFYDDPLREPALQAAPAKMAAPTKSDNRAARPELERFRQLQREVEDVRAIAIIRPTEENVRRYMELEWRVVRNASKFADLAQRIAWANPELDPSTQGRPVNASALEAYEQDQVSLRAANLAAIGRDNVLIFFFRGDCGYCHKMAPVLNAFHRRHGIPLVAVSVDGGTMSTFPGARVDNGIARALKVVQVPAVFLAQPFTGRIVPVGFGVLSDAQLAERVIAVADPQRSATSEAGTFWPN